MPIADTFLPISTQSEGLFKDKGSKFIAYAYPVKTEAEVKQYIQLLKKEHFSARHHCYAYVLGNENKIYRANDDGEPFGTAGKPILGQIQSKKLANILIVVVRYFGGTLLGKSGLIHAYREAAANAILHANIVEEIITEIYDIKFAYEQIDFAMKIIKDLHLETLNQTIDTTCSIRITIRKKLLDDILEKFEKAGVFVERI